MSKLAISEEVWRCWRGSFDPIEQPLIEWARQYQSKDKLAVDAGADVGSWTVDMAAHSAVVWAFEPGPAFRLLDYNVGDLGNVTICRVALGARSGLAELYSGRPEDGGGSLLATEEHTIVRHVPITTLDSYYLEDVGFIKIDVEGYEEAVIRGAAKTIRDSKPAIIFEMWNAELGTPQQKTMRNVANQATMNALFELNYGVTPLSWPDMYLGMPNG